MERLNADDILLVARHTAEVSAAQHVSFLSGMWPLHPGGPTPRFANVEMPEDTEFKRGFEIRKQILRDAPTIQGLRVELGGAIFGEYKGPSSESA